MLLTLKRVSLNRRGGDVPLKKILISKQCKQTQLSASSEKTMQFVRFFFFFSVLCAGNRLSNLKTLYLTQFSSNDRTGKGQARFLQVLIHFQTVPPATCVIMDKLSFLPSFNFCSHLFWGFTVALYLRIRPLLPVFLIHKFFCRR